MATLTTQEAVHQLLTDESALPYFIQAGLTKTYRRTLRYRLKNKTLSSKFQEDLLKKCGYTVAQERQWHLSN